MVAAVDSTEGLRTQAAEIGPREYVVTAWPGAAPEDPADLELVLQQLLARDPTALLLDIRAFTVVDPATVAAVTSSVRRLRAAGVFVVLVADWRDLSRVTGTKGLDRFVDIRPTLASAIEAVRGRSA